MSIRTEWTRDIFTPAGKDVKNIYVRFANGQAAYYTKNILDLLKEEKDVVDISDAETGKVLYINNEREEEEDMTMVKCACCGDYVSESETEVDGYGNIVCVDCLNTNYVWCEEEDACFAEEDVVTVSPYAGYFSRDYAENHYAQCDDCGSFFDVEGEGGYTYDDERPICRDCYVNNYYYCEDCGHLVHVSETHEIDGEYFCPNCAPEHESSDNIHPYGYKPEPVFFGRELNGLHLGVELEMELPNPSSFVDEYVPEEIYAKQDGSLGSGGVELVSHPCTLSYHRELWPDVLAAAREEGGTSHDNRRCGLHVHLERAYFGSDLVERDAAIYRFGMLFDKFWDNVVRFSRRREWQLHWAQRSDYKTTKKEGSRVHADKLRAKGGCEGRYYCVNLQNENTVEIRIFNGTLREESFIAALELCQTFADYAKNHNADEIAAATWDDVISYDGFDTLKEYCNYRNIDGTTTGDTVMLAPPR